MHNQKNTMISVVIASIGRNTLISSINSILFDLVDSKIDFEVIVVFDGVKPSAEICSKLEQHTDVI